MSITTPTHPPADTPADAPAGGTSPADPADGRIKWSGILALVDSPSSDSRILSAAGYRPRSFPLSLMAMLGGGAHGYIDPVLVGQIDSAEIQGGALVATGSFDNTDDGALAAQALADGSLRFISVDTIPIEYEVTTSADNIGDDGGGWMPLPMAAEPAPAPPADGEPAAAPDVVVEHGRIDEYVTRFLEWELTGACLCADAAFGEAVIAITASGAVEKVSTVGLVRLGPLRGSSTSPLAEAWAAAVPPAPDAAPAGDSTPEDDADVPTTAMVCLVPDDPAMFIVKGDGATSADEQHLTLAYGIDPADVEKVDAAMETLASATPEVDAKVGGIASFAEGDDGIPVVWLVDGPDVDKLHTEVAASLATAGVKPAATTHGFKAHITAGYAADQAGATALQEAMQTLGIVGEPVTFTGLTTTSPGGGDASTHDWQDATPGDDPAEAPAAPEKAPAAPAPVAASGMSDGIVVRPIGDGRFEIVDEFSPSGANTFETFRAAWDTAVRLGIANGAIVASGADAPPVEWFNLPDEIADKPGPAVRIEGRRIYGYAALWGECHTGIPGQCRVAPKSPSGYAYFERHPIPARQADGEPCEVYTGVITLGKRHAPLTASAGDVIAHYEDPSCVVADVACYENRYGIVHAGALRVGVTDEQVAQLLGADLSGHWVPIHGRNEMLALLAVNIPGYAVPRPAARVRKGEVVALTAAGLVSQTPAVRDDGIPLEVTLATLRVMSEDGIDGLRGLAFDD